MTVQDPFKLQKIETQYRHWWQVEGQTWPFSESRSVLKLRNSNNCSEDHNNGDFADVAAKYAMQEPLPPPPPQRWEFPVSYKHTQFEGKWTPTPF